MRMAEGLIALGFIPDVDFRCRDDGDGPYIDVWLSDRPKPDSFEIQSAHLRAHAASKRYQVEIAGVQTPDGPIIPSDRESQAMIAGAHAMAQAVPGQAIKFKTRDGFVDLDAAGMKAVAIAVGRHVQECFAKEAEALAGISSGAITDAAGIDTLFAKAFPNNRSG